MATTVSDSTTENLDAFDAQLEEQLGLGIIPNDAAKLEIRYVAHTAMHPDPAQPRKHPDDELRAAIQTSGILQPITVRPVPMGMAGHCECCAESWAALSLRGEYLIVDGERRWRGAAGVQARIPVIERRDFGAYEGRRLIAQAAANTGKPLTPLEEALHYERLLTLHPTMSHRQLARAVGRSYSSVSDRLATLKNPGWRDLFVRGEITVSQAVEVSRYSDRPMDVHENAVQYLRELAGAAGIASLEIAAFREALPRAYGEGQIEEPTTPPAAEPSLGIEEAKAPAAAAAVSAPAARAEPAAAPARILCAHCRLVDVAAAGDVCEDCQRILEKRGGRPDPVTQPEREPQTARPHPLAETEEEHSERILSASPIAPASAPAVDFSVAHVAGRPSLLSALAPLVRTRPLSITVSRKSDTEIFLKIGDYLQCDGTPEELERDLPPHLDRLAERLASAPVPTPPAKPAKSGKKSTSKRSKTSTSKKGK